MSTTVTYKGSTLTTADNNTKTLKTSGKYLEDDITITDVSGGFVTQDLQGFINLSPGAGGIRGAGFDHEEGTVVLTSDSNRPTINFTNTHTDPPFYASFVDVTDTPYEPSSAYSDSNLYFHYIDWYRITGLGYYNSTGGYATKLYGLYYGSFVYSASSVQPFSYGFSINSDNTAETNSSYPRYFVTPTCFRPYSGYNGRYWRAGRTYKWVAVWALNV